MANHKVKGPDGVERYTRPSKYKKTVPVDPETLKPWEEEFALLLLNGMKQTDAYLVLRPLAAKWTRGSLWRSASLLATKVDLRLKQLQEAVASPLIADAIEREKYWTSTMRDQEEATVNRLRASELLGKRQKDFSPEEAPSGPVTNIQYNVTFVTRSRDGDNAQV